MTTFNFTGSTPTDLRTFYQIMDRETDRLLYKALLGIGAVERPECAFGREFWLWTKAGPATCRPSGRCVYIQFQEPKVAARFGFPHLNRYNGKWNMIWDEKLPPQARVEDFLAQMQRCGAAK